MLLTFVRLVRVSLSIHLFVVLCNSDTKTWLRNTNFEDPSNWNGGGVICSNDRKAFPREMRASIFIQKNESLQELVLSDNMVLEFKAGAILTFSKAVRLEASPSVHHDVSGVSIISTTEPNSENRCLDKGRNLKFIGHSSSWFDPSAWGSSSLQSGAGRQFSLDIDRVPSIRDHVIFPSNNSFQTNLESQPIKASSLSIKDQVMDTQEAFEKYWNGEAAGYDFVNRSSNGNIVSACTSCDNLHHYSDEMKAVVCKHMKEDYPVPCTHPIEPTYGHCNPICGSKVKLDVELSALADNLYRSLQALLAEGLSKTTSVKYAIGPRINETMEIVLVDANNGKEASKYICKLLDLLKHNDSSYISGIRGFSFERSYGENNCASDNGNGDRIRQAKTDYVILAVSLVIGVICVLLIVLGFIFYRRRYMGNFKNEMELGDLNNRTTSQGFDNPVYGAPIPYDDNFTITYDPDVDQVHGFENILYSPQATKDPVVTKLEVPQVEEPTVRAKKSSKLSLFKKGKQEVEAGFENPVYNNENSGSMVSVPLDEDYPPSQPSPDQLANKSEAQKKADRGKKATAQPGFENPVYDVSSKMNGSDRTSSNELDQSAPEGSMASARDKRAKKSELSSDTRVSAGFENPVYNTSIPISNEFLETATQNRDVKKNGKSKVSQKPSTGFENPVFEASGVVKGMDGEEADEGEVRSVNVAKLDKKKKEKKPKTKQVKSSDESVLGFGNPIYEASETDDVYQPSGYGLDETMPE